MAMPWKAMPWKAMPWCILDCAAASLRGESLGSKA
eukprot:CAMPEP_0118975604 /NCGR_PEP_ID=MMETSP1173-20130426/16366_1 /TAXON_ID=1034831 /ORGANISM="Rhizochromulina marina cf, Strain CCMP1243" /LENGTH=34 /DNA_ID= /DNA_START= /DNA_END= /DNA_ORIENTATION=